MDEQWLRHHLLDTHHHDTFGKVGQELPLSQLEDFHLEYHVRDHVGKLLTYLLEELKDF